MRASRPAPSSAPPRRRVLPGVAAATSERSGAGGLGGHRGSAVPGSVRRCRRCPERCGGHLLSRLLRVQVVRPGARVRWRLPAVSDPGSERVGPFAASAAVTCERVHLRGLDSAVPPGARAPCPDPLEPSRAEPWGAADLDTPGAGGPCCRSGALPLRDRRRPRRLQPRARHTRGRGSAGPGEPKSPGQRVFQASMPARFAPDARSRPSRGSSSTAGASRPAAHRRARWPGAGLGLPVAA